MDWYDGAMKLPGTTPLAPPASVSARLLRSPLCVAVGGLAAGDASAVATGTTTSFVAHHTPLAYHRPSYIKPPA